MGGGDERGAVFHEVADVGICNIGFRLWYGLLFAVSHHGPWDLASPAQRARGARVRRESVGSRGFLSEACHSPREGRTGGGGPVRGSYGQIPSVPRGPHRLEHS